MSSTIEASRSRLREQFVGKDIRDVPCPSAILDVAIIRRNCQRMLASCQDLDFGFRAHVKTHKSVEITQLQVGDRKAVNLVVSTVAEAEHLAPFLLECTSQGRDINLLYGIPTPPSQVPRVAALAKKLGPGSITLMVDHRDQLEVIKSFKDFSGGVIPKLLIKIDMGGHRAGITADSETLKLLAAEISKYQESGLVELLGLYAHAGHSYYGKGAPAALDMLRQELDALIDGVSSIGEFPNALTLSVGASPTAMSLGNLDIRNNSSTEPSDMETISAARNLLATIEKIRQKSLSIEVHAGVYPILDLQQLAVHALPSTSISWSEIAVTIVAEVASLYPGRGDGGSTEALIAAGSLALGREPCKAYSGWGILTPWNMTSGENTVLNSKSTVEEHQGWQVGRISQEHGILTLKGDKSNNQPLSVGQKVRIFPNHACIALAGYNHFLVVDSSKDEGKDTVRDVWVSLQGWS